MTETMKKDKNPTDNLSDKSVAVIILNWNGERLLPEFLPKVIAATNGAVADVIVADNGSTDNSLELLRRDFTEVKLLCLDRNYGYAEGYNIAISRCEYEYVVLLNSDVAPAPGWVEPLLDYCNKHPEVAALQPKLLSYSDPTRFEYAGAAGGYIDCHGYPYCRGRLFDTVEIDAGQYDQTDVSIAWASGAALFVRRSVYLQAGGLDRLFFAHMEEIDLCWRIHRLGGDIRYVPQSTIYHLGGGSLPADNPRKTYLNFRNNLLLLYKNLPKRQGRRLIFVRRLYDTLAFAVFVAKAPVALVTGNRHEASLAIANARAVLRAHRHFRRMRSNYSPAADLPSEASTVAMLSPVNIIIEYNLRRHRTFSQLTGQRIKN